MVSGGGPLPAHVDEFCTRAGLPLLNGYGLTESSPVISVRRPGRNVLGTIGPPCPLTEVRIVDESGRDIGRQKRGVIQARGPQIMRGYWQNEAASRHALPGDGWLDTGDVGMLSSEGDLIITGRAKDTLVLMGGENVEPESMEAAITSSPYISEALVVGHGQKTLAALLVPDSNALRSFLELAKDVPDLEVIRHPGTVEKLRREVADRISRSKGYRSFELIGRIHILERPFSVDDGTLTPTMKKKRSVIEERYAAAISSLFDGDPGDFT
jgi:long-chain acyl-CoA synthetase